jgi:uncharacterized membrane protein YfcA
MDSHTVLVLAGIAAVSFVLSFLGSAVGLVLGHLRLPLLIAYLHDAARAAATNLAVSGLGALAGSFRHARAGRVSLLVLGLIGVPSAVGAAAGMLLFVKFDRFWAHILLGALLLYLGLRMARSRPPAPRPVDSPAPLGPWALLREVALGLLLGALAAVTGLMMSSLRLPLLLRLLRGDAQLAVGSNMAIGLLTALVGVATAWLAGSRFDLLALAVIGPPTMLGGYLGAVLTGKLRKETLQRVLGWAIAAMGLLMAVQGLWRATRARDLQPYPQSAAEEQAQEGEHDEWPDFEDVLDLDPEE